MRGLDLKPQVLDTFLGGVGRRRQITVIGLQPQNGSLAELLESTRRIADGMVELALLEHLGRVQGVAATATGAEHEASQDEQQMKGPGHRQTPMEPGAQRRTPSTQIAWVRSALEKLAPVRFAP